ncbi:MULTISPECIES: hypothetical protein [unclassified Sinorhizobium]|uniref:hypothetical protein n=1 Tax=unclassified Sinorhizobium TaxID=2613772 RepID=UPI0024C421AC|nr:MULTISPECIES: hypothetical protein [unclassified Sinorhizobium]MDK1374049.1 hypothetical protein [Sinorhizobium sp. 6-70]MDK1480686.1 hypothetical protein [Sinorhizobium sp. 6-117]
MITTFVFSLFVVASGSWMGARAIRDHRAAMAERRSLLDGAALLLPLARITHGADQFPILSGILGDGRKIRIELVADTMVCRRLPQLWLKVTLLEAAACHRPKLGALARPTGAEFYSLVHEMPHWFTPPPTEAALLMRGDDSASPEHVERARAMFGSLFSDPTLKEAAITPRGVRLVRQFAQGERGAHLLLRQARFAVTAIAPDLIRRTIVEAEALSGCLADDTPISPAPAAV